MGTGRLRRPQPGEETQAGMQREEGAGTQKGDAVVKGGTSVLSPPLFCLILRMYMGVRRLCP